MVIVVKKPWIEIGYYETGEIEGVALMNNVDTIRWRNYDKSGCLKEEGTFGFLEKKPLKCTEKMGR